MRFAVSIAATCLAGLLAAGGLRAAQTPGQGRPIFRAGIDIVQIDVTVLGPDGRPLHGLKVEDFTLLEDGEPQEILGFGEINIPDASDGPAWLRDASPDVRTAMDGRVLVFLLDDYTTPDDLKTRARVATVKRITNEVIDRMGPTDVAAVVCVFEKRCAQDFTNNRALLKAAVGYYVPKRFPLGFPYDWFRHSVGDAGKLVEYLIEQPGRRKAVIYVSAEMPNRPLVWPPMASMSADSQGRSLEGNVTQQTVIRTFEKAMRSKVTAYGINSAGLLPLGEADAAGLLGPSEPAAPSDPHRFGAPERSLAAETGGFVIGRPGELSEGVAQIFRETGSDHVLGYEQPPKKNTGYNMLAGFRSIEVRVNRPDLAVKTHRGYIPPPPAKPVSNPPPPAASALAGILPKNDLPLRVAVAPFATLNPKTRKLETTVAIVLGVAEPTPSARTMDRLDLQVRAFTQHGEARGMTSQQLHITIPTGRGDEVLQEVLSEIRLKPGVYALRLSAASDRLAREGSVYADVEVPDFANAPLSLSGALITSSPRPSVSGADALSAIVPVLPTTLREFGSTHLVSALVRIYQGGKAPVVPVTVTARILDAANRSVVEQTETLPVARFGTGRTADYQYQLPLARLMSGLHLLRLDVSSGAATARRDVRFSVK